MPPTIVGLFVLFGLGGFLQTGGSAALTGPFPVIDARVCSVSADPDAWNHKRIRLSGIVTKEFESFTITDPGCPQTEDAVGIWLTLGGRTSPGVIYCCPGEGQRDRAQAVTVNGITVPLIKDAMLAQFVRLLRGNETFSGRATLVGRFFAGQRADRDLNWRGYGHFGCCTLFVIERVEALAPLSAVPASGGRSDRRRYSAAHDKRPRKSLGETISMSW